MGELVMVNVGGKVFQTTMTTLTKVNNVDSSTCKWHTLLLSNLAHCRQASLAEPPLVVADIRASVHLACSIQTACWEPCLKET